MKSGAHILHFRRRQYPVLFSLLLFFFFQHLNAQVRNVGAMFISGNVYIHGNFFNAASADYLNNGNLYLRRNFSNNQPAMAEGAGTTFFTGTSRQEINGSEPPVFHHVYYDNASGVLMNQDVTIGGTISPVSGSLYFNDHTLTMNDRVNTAYTNAGAFTVTPVSNLVINGNAAAGNKLYFDIAGNTLHNLILSANATATLGNALNITAGSDFGTVTVNGELDAAGLLILKSDSLGTARVGISAGTINNEVVVERFFPAIRAWRFIGIPFSSSSQTINQAWQEGYTDRILQCPPQYTGTPGYGTAITWNNTGPGYDVHNTTKTSMQVYKDNLWITPASTLSNLVTTSPSAFPAYALFVRGDRTICLTDIYPPNITTLRPRGALNQFSGAPVMHSLAGSPGDYIFIGNPYASSVNVKNVILNGNGIYTDRFWVWNPKLGGNNGVGGYVTFSFTGGIFVPNDPSYTGGTIIQSSGAFMVQRNNTGSPGSITFHESDKSASETNFGIFGRGAPPNGYAPAIFINLLDPAHAVMDGAGAVYGKKYAAEVDSADVPKRWNEEIENLALIREDKALAIELRPAPFNTDTLFLQLYLRQHPYVLQVFSQNLPAGLPGKAWIVDKYLSRQTEIDIYDTSLYSFNVNTDTNSYRNRFMLVFNRMENRAADSFAVSKIAASVYPNPVTGRFFNLVLKNLEKDDYTVHIYTAAGTLATTLKFSYSQGREVYPVKIPANIAAGNYTVQVINSSGLIISSMPLLIAQ